MYIKCVYIVYIAYIQYWRSDVHMDIIISNSTGEPIYTQITSQIKAMIMTGELKAGDALPSMRNLAAQLRISVITTKRAYEDLERDGFIESYTGRGSFVKAQKPELLREETLKQIESILTSAVNRAKIGNVSLTELHEIMDFIYNEN